ncbi:hypothetical protein Pcinc_015332 [Petrolisthes cinctipes]|uniref:Uncharacterized protein n=1 Tax=Petrolisthes cinctipes TaxID=88211 RepID=A0AAE1KN90_PETCI|nr:hypothetical protein Pcinc_015332 [Petrolisthes cinctipes]
MLLALKHLPRTVGPLPPTSLALARPSQAPANAQQFPLLPPESQTIPLSLRLPVPLLPLCLPPCNLSRRERAPGTQRYLERLVIIIGHSIHPYFKSKVVVYKVQ